MTSCAVVELRQYTLHPGARDVLIDLFERELIEPQEEAGMQVIGQFRDLHDPNRFVWLRGFADMRTRRDALAAFYGGPVWRAHRDAANATMIDSDDVLLLRPVHEGSGFDLAGAQRLPHGASKGTTNRLTVATIYPLKAPAGDAFLTFLESEVEPILSEHGALRAAAFTTEYGANDFQALPVREGEHVLVRFTTFADASSYAHHVERLTRSPRWTDAAVTLAHYLHDAPTALELAPTARSFLR